MRTCVAAAGDSWWMPPLVVECQGINAILMPRGFSDFNTLNAVDTSWHARPSSSFRLLRLDSITLSACPPGGSTSLVIPLAIVSPTPHYVSRFQLSPRPYEPPPLLPPLCWGMFPRMMTHVVIFAWVTKSSRSVVLEFTELRWCHPTDRLRSPAPPPPPHGPQDSKKTKAIWWIARKPKKHTPLLPSPFPNLHYPCFSHLVTRVYIVH